jgi:hypothetical protein
MISFYGNGYIKIIQIGPNTREVFERPTDFKSDFEFNPSYSVDKGEIN